MIYYTVVKRLIWLMAAALALSVTACERNPRARLVGNPAPDFTVTDSDHTVALHDLHGQLVLLNFWAAHCGPCIDEMPSLVQLQARMGSKITILGVGVDTSNDDYHQFLRQFGVNFLTVRDPDKKSYYLYGATGYPETTIIDRSGTVRRKFVGPKDWNSPEIVEYLQKL
ncbi:MAG TPA: TlpA disulfide reductase family protein [Candidatus Angelobacter sp.]|nr:TlpA disulfide reductase family protein [Candidatus Angelobacter sp.]